METEPNGAPAHQIVDNPVANTELKMLPLFRPFLNIEKEISALKTPIKRRNFATRSSTTAKRLGRGKTEGNSTRKL